MGWVSGTRFAPLWKGATCDRTGRWGGQKTFERVGMAIPDEPRGGLNAVSPWARSEASPTAAQGVGGATPSAGSHPPAETRKPRGGGTRSAAGGQTPARGNAQPDEFDARALRGRTRGVGTRSRTIRRSSVVGANPGRGGAQPDIRRSSVGGANRRRGNAQPDGVQRSSVREATPGRGNAQPDGIRRWTAGDAESRRAACRDEACRDETRRDETRRDETCRDGICRDRICRDVGARDSVDLLRPRRAERPMTLRFWAPAVTVLALAFPAAGLGATAPRATGRDHRLAEHRRPGWQRGVARAGQRLRQPARVLAGARYAAAPGAGRVFARPDRRPVWPTHSTGGRGVSGLTWFGRRRHRRPADADGAELRRTLSCRWA